MSTKTPTFVDNRTAPEPKITIDKTRQELLDELHRLFVYMDATPTTADMRWNGRYAPDDYLQKFGSWNNAVRAAGLPTV